MVPYRAGMTLLKKRSSVEAANMGLGRAGLL